MTPTDEAIARALWDVADDDAVAASSSLRDWLPCSDAPSDVLVVTAYAEVLANRGGVALDTVGAAVEASRGCAPDVVACALAIQSMALAFVGPTAQGSLADLADAADLAHAAAAAVAEPSPWLRYLLAEGSMSAGNISRAIEVSGSGPPATDPVIRVLLSQVQARALAFGGQLKDAQDAVDVTLDLAREHQLRGVEALAHGLASYLCAQRGERARLRASARAALALAHSPVSHYLHTGAHVLVGFALAADEQYPLAAATLLAGGGPDLERLQYVDRAYGYELLAGAAVHAGDPVAAAHWLARAQAMPAEGMVAAAVARTEAMVRAAEGKLPAGALAAMRAVQDAGSMGGSLDATRAHLLHGSALSRIGSRSKALEELERVTVAATELGALRIRAQAVREMRRLGRRVPPPGRTGLDLSPRELQVALLVADGLSNRQVARLLLLSERTVQSHLVTILRRLAVPSRAALPQALGRPRTDLAIDLALLTARQRDVAELVARGMSNAAIATELAVSPKTVEKHVGDILTRCTLSSRTALAAAWAATP